MKCTIAIAALLLTGLSSLAGSASTELASVASRLNEAYNRVVESPEYQAAQQAETAALLAWRSAVSTDAKVADLDARIRQLEEELTTLQQQRLEREKELATGELARDRQTLEDARSATESMLKTPEIQALEAEQAGLAVEAHAERTADR